MFEHIYRMKFVQYILYRRRMKRAQKVVSIIDLSQGNSIIDIGCGPNGRSFEDFAPSQYNIVGIDIIDANDIKNNHPNFTYHRQDAVDLSMFCDKQFDVAISIGMMEHICERQTLLKIAKEIRRVSKHYVVIVPWRYAWLEPHFKFPFFGILPSFLQLHLIRFFNLHNLGNAVRGNTNYIAENYQWLTSNEWLKIFPGTRVKLMGTLETIAIIG